VGAGTIAKKYICNWILLSQSLCSFQLNVFLKSLSGSYIGFTVLRIFVIDRNTIPTVFIQAYLDKYLRNL